MLLSISRVAKAYGVDIVLEDATFRLDHRDKAALVGRNGAGKTTLLKLLTGQELPDAGSIHWARGAKVGYLKQEAPVDLGRTVLEEARSALEAQLKMQDRLRQLEAKLEVEATDDDLEEYAMLHEHFSESEGYSAERDVLVVLKRLGFEEGDHDKPTSLLSGGEKTRLALARILLEEPDLLILDEPTNHLDLQATEWLEGWIRQYHGAVLLVSHDRAFLERTADRVLDIRGGKVRSYPGDFRQYLRLRQEEDAALTDLAAKQQEQIAKMDEFVRRFMNSQRTAQARGRLKQMEKLKAERVYAPVQEKGMAAGFREMKRSGDTVVQAEGLSVGFPDETLYTGLDWTVRWGDRWGVIGENGAGKSTLIRVLLGRLPALAGRIRLGANVDVGYFSQDTTDLDPDWSPLEYIIYACDLEAAKARDLLGRFLFHGDDVFRPISSLSGGEKNKLVLARLTYENPNLLILDEPTNHLDMDSREALARVLSEYQGTLILVSHDRWLLGQVTRQMLDVRRNGPVIFPGSYGEYRESQIAPPQPNNRTGVKGRPPDVPKLSPREESKEIQRLEKLVVACELAVTKAESALAKAESKLSDIPEGADVLALTQAYQACQAELASAMQAWESSMHELESLKSLRN